MNQSDNFETPGTVHSEEGRIPGVLWVALIALGVITLLTLMRGVSGGSAAALVAAGCNVLILVGLILGQRWAYVLLMVFSLAGVGVAFSKGIGQGMAVLIGNGIVVVPVLLSTGYFFGRSRQNASPRNSRAIESESQ